MTAVKVQFNQYVSALSADYSPTFRAPRNGGANA
jgi:hypothetical protein